ncbi:Gfo/Idh/MocA family protein [Dactylosporangium sp. CA-139066]|uniref:Gfo/Idh/MocA family protein n=1 Tax=Dactylosporangium sp. CA-139066 TaxID=3239930 RepID=UPI003D8D95D6
MRPLGLGLVGAGEVAARHVQAADSVPEVRIAATYDLRPERSTVPDFDALLAHPGVEVVVLTVPHALHEDLAVRALAAGKHVLVEKPMATTTAACARMIAAAEAAGTVLWVGQQQRQFAHVRAARDLLRSGELGEIRAYREIRSNHYGPGRPAWFFDPGLAGGGVAMLVGIHTIDRAAILLGAAPVAVAATTETPPGWRIETSAEGELFFDAPFTCHFRWYSAEDFQYDTTVECERGALHLDPAGLTVAGRRVVDFDADREYTESFARQYRALARTVREGAGMDIQPAEGLAAVAAVAAIYASSQRLGVRMPISS